jgi:hypothetical protein
MMNQMKADGKIIQGCVGLQPAFDVNVVEDPKNAALYSKGYKDDITKQPLLDDLVDAARAVQADVPRHISRAAGRRAHVLPGRAGRQRSVARLLREASG